ncbi:MAG: hypothetical protein AAFP04_03490 [Myxococcota bacterium]
MQGADIERARESLANRIKSRLAKPAISVIDARDGIRDCFVSTYLGGLAHGFARMNIQGDAQSIASVAERILRDKLREAGASWETPTVEALEAIKDRTDQEMHIVELPAELREVHDRVCDLLLAKASGLLEHHGDRSVVGRSSSVPTAAAKAAPDPIETNLRQTVIAYLSQFSEAVQRGESPSDLMARTAKLSRLLETLEEMIGSGAQ